MEKGEKEGSSVIYVVEQLRICNLQCITIAIANPHAGNTG